MDGKCDFCPSVTYEKQGIIENSVARVLYPLRPVVFGNFMVITKRHVALFTELTDEEVVGIRDLISTLFEGLRKNGRGDGFNLLNNNNKAGDQHIPHVHIHVFIRREGEVSPFDVLSKKVEKVKISEEEWNSRLAEIRSWFE